MMGLTKEDIKSLRTRADGYLEDAYRRQPSLERIVLEMEGVLAKKHGQEKTVEKSCFPPYYSWYLGYYSVHIIDNGKVQDYRANLKAILDGFYREIADEIASHKIAPLKEGLAEVIEKRKSLVYAAVMERIASHQIPEMADRGYKRYFVELTFGCKTFSTHIFNPALDLKIITWVSSGGMVHTFHVNNEVFSEPSREDIEKESYLSKLLGERE
jgi:hypothetical protein